MLPQGAKACELIEMDLGNWNTRLSKQAFLPYEANYILLIPVNLGYDDNIIWQWHLLGKKHLHLET